MSSKHALGKTETLLGEGKEEAVVPTRSRGSCQTLSGPPGSDTTGTCVFGSGEEQQKRSMSEHTEEVIFRLVFKQTWDCRKQKP